MKKPKLYIIHGWTYTTAPWTRTIGLLEKKGIKVEMLHVPGLTTPSKKVWTIDDYVKWADRNIPKGSIALGHSNGGRILLNLCSEKPDKLKHLILLDAAGIYEISNKRDVVRTISKKMSFLKHVPGLTKIWHKLTGSTDYARAPENMKRTLSNMLESDRSLDLSKVLTPTSILWGAADTVTPPRQAEMMHVRIINSTLEIFPDWTHAPYLSHPVELAKAIYAAFTHPPEIKLPAVDSAAAVSAALAMKKAPEPVLEAKEPQNSVAPSLPTKLVLRTGEKITAGMVVSDTDAAAVKYRHKSPEVLTKSTNAGKISASASLKKAAIDKTPDTDAVAASASASLRKSTQRTKAPEIVSSAGLLSNKRITKVSKSQAEETSLLAELDQKSVEKVDFVPLDPTKSPSQPLPGAITSASVPKVSRLEKAKRKVRSVSKKTKTTKVRKRA